MKIKSTVLMFYVSFCVLCAWFSMQMCIYMMHGGR